MGLECVGCTCVCMQARLQTEVDSVLRGKVRATLVHAVLRYPPKLQYHTWRCSGTRPVKPAVKLPPTLYGCALQFSTHTQTHTHTHTVVVCLHAEAFIKGHRSA